MGPQLGSSLSMGRYLGMDPISKYGGNRWNIFAKPEFKAYFKTYMQGAIAIVTHYCSATHNPQHAHNRNARLTRK